MSISQRLFLGRRPAARRKKSVFIKKFDIFRDLRQKKLVTTRRNSLIVNVYVNARTETCGWRREFGLKFGTFSVFADIFNRLGNKYVRTGLNPWGVWYPDAADPLNTALGTYEPDSNYKKITSVSGLRTFKLSARFTF